MSGLPREALQILELMPQWQRREAYRSDTGGVSAALSGALMVVVVRTPQERLLWDRMVQWLHRLGCPSHVIDQALVLTSEQADRLAHEVLAKGPQTVWSFSSGMMSALRASTPQVLSSVRVVEWPDLSLMLRDGRSKAHFWSALVREKQNQWECFSTPISASRS